MENRVMEMESPFQIPPEDVNAICEDEAFQFLRSYLSRNAENRFCAHHTTLTPPSQQTYLLHRDLLHALITPLSHLFTRASSLASAALCTTTSHDLELAFSGDARSAFLWLQCFVSEEEDWCKTIGCPACIVTGTLSTESHIRITIAAALLSTSEVATPASSRNSSPENSPATTPLDAPRIQEKRGLPPLPHILPALREALGKDEFWGPDHWTYLLSRANLLNAGIHALIAECKNLEALVASGSPISPVASSRPSIVNIRVSSAPVPTLAQPRQRARLETEREEVGMKLQKSRLAKRQLRMRGEEVELLKRRALQCWGGAAGLGEVKKVVLENPGRVRRLTCP